MNVYLFSYFILCCKIIYLLKELGTRSWLGHYAISRKIAGSIHVEVFGFFSIELSFQASLLTRFRLNH
jgi:CRISPR/Cas system-associated exonuclease Cas4 (RecB family)